jgi:hypothetical protein
MFSLFPYFFSKFIRFVSISVFIVALLAITNPIFPANGQQKTNWKPWKKSANAELSYRETVASDLIEVKAKITLNSSLSGFILFLLDTDNIPQWLANAKASKILQTLDDHTHIFTTEFHGLWLINNREMIIRSHIKQHQDLSVAITIENAHHFDKQPHTVLVDVISARWLITPISSKEIEIEYSFIVDPKGNIPAWLANKMTLKSTWQTLQNIQQQLPHSTWQKSTLASIKEQRN